MAMLGRYGRKMWHDFQKGEFHDWVQNSTKELEKNHQHSNDKINGAFDTVKNDFFGALGDFVHGKKSFVEAHKNADGSWDKSRIAGSAFTGYAGFDALTRLNGGGGDLTHDNRGNTDIVGIPFI